MGQGKMISGERTLLSQGDRVGLVCCSNGLLTGDKSSLSLLKKKLALMGLKVVESPFLYRGETAFSGSGKERACALMDFYRNETIRAVFDVSGGDMANEVLNYLDFEMIRASDMMFFGYSDLTTIINAIYTKTGKKSGLYQIRNLIRAHKDMQTSRFRETLVEGKNSLMNFNCSFLRGIKMEGIVLGGNIRCLLKLAGTEFWPDMVGKVLFLECNGGEVPQIVTYFSQLKQMGVFGQVAGLLLGTFTRIDDMGLFPIVEEVLLENIGPELPVARTMQIGHGSDSSCLMIGEYMKIQRIL